MNAMVSVWNCIVDLGVEKKILVLLKSPDYFDGCDMILSYF